MSATVNVTRSPVVVIHQNSNETSNNNDEQHKKKRPRTSNSSNSKKTLTKNKSSPAEPPTILHPKSSSLFDNMLHPLSRSDFLRDHFRKDAVHIQRGQHLRSTRDLEVLLSDIRDNYLFGLDVRQIFAETSSENVFLWLRPPPSSSSDDSSENNTKSAAKAKAVNSVEISDPETAHALHTSGCHPAYCRAPPLLEQHLVGSLLKATGLGGGHYHPPHEDTVTLGGGTSLGRGEVELFIGAADGSSSSSKSKMRATGGKKHTTGWHTDFQENFTIQLSGIKRWTLRRGRVKHPLRGTTPHYARDSSIIESQLKIARLSCLGGNSTTPNAKESDASKSTGSYGFEYNENNTIGEEQTVTLHPGDVFYFPSGMWHTVETIEPGVSLNVSLMGTTYANLVCEALQHVMVGSDERWREVVTCHPGANGDGSGNDGRLEGLLGGLSQLVDNFVTRQGGAQSLLPPALCHPPLGQEEEEDANEDGNENDRDSSNEEEDDNSDGSGGPIMEDDCGWSDDENSGPPTSGIIVSLDDFEGPPGWNPRRTMKNAKLVKNPLACLIAMSEISTAIGQQPTQEECDEEQEEKTTKQYLLNVNFAGNEMMESYVRVILETSSDVTMGEMDQYLSCEAQGLDPDIKMVYEDDSIKSDPPLCLFYYGYFSWSRIE